MEVGYYAVVKVYFKDIQLYIIYILATHMNS